jgi:hypothetical protein
MIALPLALALALTGVDAPARNRPHASAATEETASSTSDMSDAEVAQRVQTYLGALDRPVSADRWRALGPRAVPILAGIARDSQALPSRRAKALGALSVLGGTSAQQTILDVARSDVVPFSVRASAIEGAGRLLAAKDLSRELKPIMEHAAHAPVRAVAAETLARHAPRSTCSAVRAQAARERADHRASFGKALERCEQAEP